MRAINNPDHREAVLEMLEDRGWQWQGDFIYAPNKMLWLNKDLDFGTLKEFHKRFYERLAKMKAIMPEPQYEPVYRQVVDDNESLVNVLSELLEKENGS
jgi:hypothetical protein